MVNLLSVGDNRYSHTFWVNEEIFYVFLEEPLTGAEVISTNGTGGVQDNAQL
jgi:hypothetical protein